MPTGFNGAVALDARRDASHNLKIIVDNATTETLVKSRACSLFGEAADMNRMQRVKVEALGDCLSYLVYARVRDT